MSIFTNASTPSSSAATLGGSRKLSLAKLARAEMASGAKDVNLSKEGRAVASVSSEATTAARVKTGMLSSINSARVTVTQMQNDARQLQNLQTQKLALASAQQANIDAGRGIDADLARQFDELTTRQHEIALSRKMGDKRMMAASAATDLEFTMTLDGGRVSRQIFKTMDVATLYAHTEAAKAAMQTASVAPELLKVVEDADPGVGDGRARVIEGVNAAYNYINSLGERTKLGVLDYVQEKLLPQLNGLLGGVGAPPIDALANYGALTHELVELIKGANDIIKPVLLHALEIVEAGAGAGVSIDDIKTAVKAYLNPYFGVLNTLDSALEQGEVVVGAGAGAGAIDDDGGDAIKNAEHANFAVLKELISAMLAKIAVSVTIAEDAGGDVELHTIAPDAPLWTPGAVDAAGGAFAAQYITIPVLNQVFGRTLAGYDGVAALKGAYVAGIEVDVHNVCTIDTPERLKITLAAEQEIAEQFSSRNVLIAGVAKSLETLEASYKDNIADTTILNDMLLRVNPVELNRDIHSAEQAYFTIATLVNKTEHLTDQVANMLFAKQ